MKESEKSDANPYESPQEAESLTSGQVAKRAMGVGAILLLTPPAMVIATGTSCGVSLFLRPPIPLIPLITAGLPLGLLFGLMAWAASIDRQQRGFNRVQHRARILLTVAPTVALWTIFAFVLAIPGGAVVGEIIQGGSLWAILGGTVIFCMVPSVVLVVMLCRAWLAGPPK